MWCQCLNMTKDVRQVDCRVQRASMDTREECSYIPNMLACDLKPYLTLMHLESI